MMIGLTKARWLRLRELMGWKIPIKIINELDSLPVIDKGKEVGRVSTNELLDDATDKTDKRSWAYPHWIKHPLGETFDVIKRAREQNLNAQREYDRTQEIAYNKTVTQRLKDYVPRCLEQEVIGDIPNDYLKEAGVPDLTGDTLLQNLEPLRLAIEKASDLVTRSCTAGMADKSSKGGQVSWLHDMLNKILSRQDATLALLKSVENDVSAEKTAIAAIQEQQQTDSAAIRSMLQILSEPPVADAVGFDVTITGDGTPSP
jgi:hypothetical protein